MSETTPSRLVLQPTGHEGPPNDPVECLDFTADALAGPFRGRTRFSIYRRDLDALLEELDAMTGNLAGEAHARCGWDETVYFEFAARFVGRTGRIAVALELANPGSHEHMHRLLLDFETEPELLQRFAADLRRVVEHGQNGPVRLEGVRGY